jgi:hypothetical protein
MINDLTLPTCDDRIMLHHLDQQSLRSLITQIYDAAIDRHKWSGFLGCLGEVTAVRTLQRRSAVAHRGPIRGSGQTDA